MTSTLLCTLFAIIEIILNPDLFWAELSRNALLRLQSLKFLSMQSLLFQNHSHLSQVRCDPSSWANKSCMCCIMCIVSIMYFTLIIFLPVADFLLHTLDKVVRPFLVKYFDMPVWHPINEVTLDGLEMMAAQVDM